MSSVEIISIIISSITIIMVGLTLIKVKKADTGEIGTIRAELISAMKSLSEQQKNMSELTITTIKTYNETTATTLNATINSQMQQLANLEARLNEIFKTNDANIKQASAVLEKGLEKMQEDNAKKLEEMRQTVDEKLNSNLEKRLTESFNVINNRLQSVYEGLGEMKHLATGVGDLKKVLTNVKTRGAWGEVQLGNLLEQMLSKEQYEEQFAIKNNGERVDYAVKMPGKDDKNIYLPIDAKFPIEDYQRLCDASEVGDVKEVENCAKALERRVKDEAKKIRDKYIEIPTTTDFAVMFLAIEGLYAEVLRRPGLAEYLQQEYKVIVCGPTTLSALLNSLQLGFKTLSIEKRSSEIWALLGSFKQEFSRFVELLSKTQRKLEEASTTIENATKKTMTIQKKLKSIQIDNEEEISLIGEKDEEDN